MFLYAPIQDMKVERAEGGAYTRSVGTCVVYGARSVDMGGWHEEIVVGAFDKSIERDDIRHLKNHDGNLLLGRTKSKTLLLTSDASGVHFDNALPATTYAQDLAVSMDRGDINQCSFAYFTDDAQWDTQNSKPLRRVAKGRLVDTSIVTYPAFPQTKAKLRSAYSDADEVDDTLALLTELIARESKAMPEAVNRALCERAAALAEAAKALRLKDLPPDVPPFSAEAAQRREERLRAMESILGGLK